MVILLGSITLLGRLGLVWAAAAPGLAGGAYALMALLYVGHVDGVPVRRAFVGLGRVLLACAGMTAAVLLSRRLHNPRLDSFGLLILDVSVGIVAYVGLAFVVAPAQVRDLLTSLSRLRESRHQRSRIVLENKLQMRDADG